MGELYVIAKMRITLLTLTVTILACFFSACKESERVNNKSSASVSKVAKYERVFSEQLLNQWGYETVDFVYGHYIKSIKNYGSDTEKFYARFHLDKKSFASKNKAQEYLESSQKEVESDPLGKNYTRFILYENSVYSISATSNYTYLEHQPKLTKIIREHIISKL